MAVSDFGTAHDLDPYVAVPSANTVGARIRLLRQRRGLTQEDFATLLGVSRSAIALWETGRGGETGHLARIASALDVPVAFFVTGMARSDVTLTLTLNEHALVTAYRASDATAQVALLRAAERLEAQSRERRLRAPPSGQ